MENPEPLCRVPKQFGYALAPYRKHETTDTFEMKAPDGTTIFVRRWKRPSSGQRGGSALLVHGLGEHSGRYGHVANVLNEAGFDVWAHDHRGFGKSGGARAQIPDRNTLLDDTKLVFERLKSEEGGNPLLLGHSMGGAIAARAVTGGRIEPRALVLSSPGLRSYINAPMRALTSGLEFVLPNLAIPHGLPLHTISHDAEVLAEAAADLLNHALISPRMTMFILEAGEAAIRDAGKLKVPTLVQAAGDDKLVDPSGAKDFAAAAPAGLCTLKIYDGLWHEIYNEREPDRSRVFSDLKDWLARVVLR
jgi:alpha-beta hydrolase superfamily lysophospholipase